MSASSEPQSLPEILDRCWPTTKKWLHDRGYITYVHEDGKTSPCLTEKGREYFDKLAPHAKNSNP